jgi:hypothetical protein
MTDDRYIVLRVVYERQFRYGRSLAWVAPELSDVDLTITADEMNDFVSSRTWAGIVDGPTYKRLAEAWRLGPEIAARTRDLGAELPGPQACSYVLDGMNWEVDDESPIVYVSLLVRRALRRANSGTGSSPEHPHRPPLNRTSRPRRAHA